MTDIKNMNLKELAMVTKQNLKSLGYSLWTIQMENSCFRAAKILGQVIFM